MTEPGDRRTGGASPRGLREEIALEDDRIEEGDPLYNSFYHDLFWQRFDTPEGRLCFKHHRAAYYVHGANDLQTAERLLTRALTFSAAFGARAAIHRVTLRSLGETQVLLGAFDRAAETFARLVEAAETQDARQARLFLAKCQRRLGRLDDAAAVFQERIAEYEKAGKPEHPGAVDALYGMACIARAWDSTEEASQWMGRALRGYCAEMCSIGAQEWVLDPDARRVVGGLLAAVAPRPGDHWSFPKLGARSGYVPSPEVDYDELVRRWWQQPLL